MKMPAVHYQPVEKPHQQDKWLFVGEVAVEDTEYLLKMMTRHIRQGELIKLEYADRNPIEGQYRSHTSHTINFHGHHAPTENLIRVYRERS